MALLDRRATDTDTCWQPTTPVVGRDRDEGQAKRPDGPAAVSTVHGVEMGDARLLLVGSVDLVNAQGRTRAVWRRSTSSEPWWRSVGLIAPTWRSVGLIAPTRARRISPTPQSREMRPS
jgi:hypothetical protein